MLRQQNANLPKGQISDERMTADILSNDQLMQASDYRNLTVGYHNGAAVRLSDVADVQDSVQNVRVTGFSNEKRSVLVLVFRQPGANLIDTVERIHEAMPSLKAEMPAAIDLNDTIDRTAIIRESVRDVEGSLGVSIALVILVVFVFLAQCARDADRHAGGSRFADRHFRRDVPASLQRRQPVADGRDDCHRLCGG